MLQRTFVALLLCTAATAHQSRGIEGSNYLVGVGMACMTGPAAEVNMMGYADVGQVSQGIHIRQYSRAFIFVDATQPSNRFVFVTCELGEMSQLLRLAVLRQLSCHFGPNCPYTTDNVALTVTHTHSTPAGYFQTFLYDVTSLGFVSESYNAYLKGIVRSIIRAHRNIQPANIFFNKGPISGAQLNRSPTAYLANPLKERLKYDSNVDNIMRLIRIDSVKTGLPFGTLNWFPVHGTSMNNTNTLISGDNKGYAAQMFERHFNSSGKPYAADLAKNPPTVIAAFAQAAEGDVSPNTAGPRCIDTGLPCHAETSTCHGDPGKCIAFGPGRDMEESTAIIGKKQWEGALRLFQNATEILGGPLRYIHRYVDMANVSLTSLDGTVIKTCLPAVGFAFAGGTTDGSGPGIGLHQDMHCPEGGMWNFVPQYIKKPTAQMKLCHDQKQILLATGMMNDPYPWHPRVVSVQIVQLGRLVLLLVPGEFTTMSGRRLAEKVKEVFKDDVEVVVVSLSNGYIHYVTTPEEYTVQRYEGASTIFGPNELTAFIEIYKLLARALVRNETELVPTGPSPPIRLRELWSFRPEIVSDSAGFGCKFGDITHQPAKPLYRWHEVVSAKFVAGHPRNSVGQRTLKTFMEVQRLSGFQWIVVATDAEWETKFKWRRENLILGTSSAKLEWTVPEGTSPGFYRLCYLGHHKTGKSVKFFRGCSATFNVLDQF